jgi:hypothetical protein
MRITYLNGTRLKRAFIAGARKVIQRREYLNRINVFPVADSDTGTNMAATLEVIVNRLLGVREPAFSAVARIAADSALDGARGNSGTILAQFFFGIAEAVDDDIRVTTKRFAQVARDAVDHAYSAIASPKEGTILTVLREWADTLHRGSSDDFQVMLESAMPPTIASLNGTQESLVELRRAGVVDAGAQGFVDMLEGIVGFIGSGRIREIEGFHPPETPQTHLSPVSALGDITFRYCTECILEGSGLDHASLREELSKHGDSLILAGSSEKTKIHLHTDQPSKVFGYLTEKGKVVGQKIDDMRRQYRAAHASHRDCALVVDSTCDLPPELLEELDIHVVPTHLVFDDSVFIDKLGITPSRFFEMMRERPEVIASTSQPAPGEFLRVFEFLAEHYRHILYLGLSEALSGTIQSARTAATHLKADLRIIDSRQVSVGLGLIVRRVGAAIRSGAGVEEAEALCLQLIPRTHLVLTVPSLDGLVRSGRIGKESGRFVNLLNLKPIISLDPHGRLTPIGAAFGEAASWSRLLRHTERFVAGRGNAEYAIAHAGASEAAGRLRQLIKERFETTRDVYIIEGAPALAAHAGLGVVAIASIVP